MVLDYTMLYSVILYVTQLYYAMFNHTIRIYYYYCTTVLVFAAWATNEGGSERERGTRNSVQRMQQVYTYTDDMYRYLLVYTMSTYADILICRYACITSIHTSYTDTSICTDKYVYVYIYWYSNIRYNYTGVQATTEGVGDQQ